MAVKQRGFLRKRDLKARLEVNIYFHYKQLDVF